ncbi:MAG: hypothetical protein KJZ78_16695, partial [Bryobacteraceae bacterium]|nr:hypothetical protein [Bryobacteraceae bacterium]
MSSNRRTGRFLALLAVLCTNVFAEAAPEILRWTRLPELPRAIAGGFAGEANGALLVGGGTYFENSGSENGAVVPSDLVFVLTPGGAGWKIRRLERPRAFAAAVPSNRGLILMGGTDSTGPSTAVNSLQWDGDRLKVYALPHLPAPLVHSRAALLDGVVYLAGGQRSLTGAPVREFRALRLDGTGAGWQELEPWPG